MHKLIKFISTINIDINLVLEDIAFSMTYTKFLLRYYIGGFIHFASECYKHIKNPANSKILATLFPGIFNKISEISEPDTVEEKPHDCEHCEKNECSEHVEPTPEPVIISRQEEIEPEVVLEYLNVARALGRDDEWIHSEMGYQLGYNPETRKEALEHFERAMELGRDDAWIFEVTGTVLLNFDRYEEALDYFRKAYAKDEDGWYLYSMGECLRKLGRYEEAIEVLLESRQISIDEDDVVDGEDLELAHSYLGIGDKDNAQKYLNSARDSIDKQGTLNDDIKREIEEIEKGILSLKN